MNKQRHSNYLKAMGIEEWRLKDTSSFVQEEQVLSFALTNESKHVVAVGCLEPRDKNPETWDLLEKIAAALKTKITNKPVETANYALIFGQAVLPASLKVERIINAPRLSELIHQPVLKKTLWKQLQVLLQ